MGAHKEYTETDRKTAIRLYKKGWGCLKVSQVVGCYPSTIKRWIEHAIASGTPGLEKHPSPAHPEKFRKKVIAEYLARTDQSLKKVAVANGISHHTLHRWLEREGIMTRSCRPKIYSHKKILEDIKSGMKKKDIAAKYGCSESWVYRVQAGF